MAKMCPMSGCKDTPGMCVHDKMMIGLVVIVVLYFVARSLGWF